ncbi:MAG: hypothetical protein ACTSPY_15840 [Candidatus Helarchaeota archaeon]
MPGRDGTGPDGKGGCGIPGGYYKFRGMNRAFRPNNTNNQNPNIRSNSRFGQRGGRFGRGCRRRGNFNNQYPGNGPYSHLPPEKRPGWTGIIPDD